MKAINIKNIKNLLIEIRGLLSFIVLLIGYLMMSTTVNFTASKYCPKFLGILIAKPVTKVYDMIVELNRHSESSINRVNLIELSIKNMRFKKSRTLITIGGMSIGIAAIIFLVSIGYGLQKLVTSRVARLDEMRQADVITQPGSSARINDKTLSDFAGLKEITHSLPLIALVGKVNYNDSVTDMAVYGVTADYLQQSAIKPVKGEVFSNNEISVQASAPLTDTEAGQVAGVSDSSEMGIYNTNTGTVEFNIQPQEWIRVRKEPSLTSPVLGYTKRSEGIQSGNMYWGSTYGDSQEYGKIGEDINGRKLGKWIKSKVQLWEKVENSYVPINELSGSQLQYEGYFAVLDTIRVRSYTPNSGSVLGESDSKLAQADTTTGTSTSNANTTEATNTNNTDATTESNNASTTDDPTAAARAQLFENIVEIDGEIVYLDEATAGGEKIKKVPLATSAVKEAVVNRAMLKVLDIPEADAVGKIFTVSFIIPSTLIDSPNEKVQSENADYKITGVIPQDDSPFFYVPFIDLRGLGITNYSQIKVVTSNQDQLQDIRRRIEGMGFITSSVTDTVEQINRLFATARTVLALIGTVALAVASLGMFNTLTVSLLERIREIGLMKAMGMKSYEVKELFLTESMIMGFFGGLLGVGMGYLAGKLLSLGLTLIGIRAQVGVVDISYVPPSIIVLVMVLSIAVGLITGIYPAKRATSISALNALRYE